MSQKKIALLSILIVVLPVLGVNLIKYEILGVNKNQTKTLSSGDEIKLTSVVPSQSLSPSPSITIENINPSSVYIEVPFAPQAPFGDWKDPRQQDACEEISCLMAIRWARGDSLTYDEALKELIAIADYEQKNYGDYRDTSANDTLTRIINGYFHYYKASVKPVNTSLDIIKELMTGNIVVVPLNGRALNNPYFTQPGPERHELVVKGFDMENNEFITNDPGIKQGLNYRYHTDVLFNAIRDYPTGYHVPIKEISKVMIVVEKQ